jgi:hypothetical protein
MDVGRPMVRCQTRIMLLNSLVQMDTNQVMAREEPCEVVQWIVYGRIRGGGERDIRFT